MSERKPIFFTSDLHHDHANVIVYSKRPFKDVNHMNEVLINNYNSTVPSNGICYFVGDIGLGKSGNLKRHLSRMHGTKVLVLGNHDKGVNTMYDSGFDVVVHGLKMVIAGQVVTVSHCPLRGIAREDVSQMERVQPGEGWHGEYRLGEHFSFPDFGQFHLHGHCHAPNNGKSKKILDRQFDVGVDGNGYRPVSISVIESWIAKYGK